MSKKFKLSDKKVTQMPKVLQTGKAALKELCGRYQQLSGLEERGAFVGSERDELFEMQTSEAAVLGIYFDERADFELFIKSTVYKDKPVPKSMGACTISGLVNLQKSAAAPVSLSGAMPVSLPGATRQSFKESLIVLSKGEYSAVPAEAVGLDKGEWLEKSLRIRLYHESAHIVCRARFAGQKRPVWDELLADCIGLLAAFGAYDRALALRLVGIDKDGSYIGGRLENYFDDKENIGRYVSFALQQTELLQKAALKEFGADASQRNSVISDGAIFDFCLKMQEAALADEGCL